jgi:DNA-directed RNA polymerase specialized sigma24 family protein
LAHKHGPDPKSGKQFRKLEKLPLSLQPYAVDSLAHAREGIERWVLDAASSEGQKYLTPAEKSAHAYELGLLYYAMVMKLPPRGREVFRLNRIEGLGHDEIAGRLGTSVDAVKSHLADAAIGVAEIQESLDAKESSNNGR